MKKFWIPTGCLFVDQYEKGELETLSIGDYGKKYNVKADFLGFTDPISGVPNVTCMPLSEKWVVTLSTQYGCPMKCTFCDVPKVKFHGNVSFSDLKKQLYSAIGLFPTVKYTERLNVHFARMGDPIFNESVFDFARWLASVEGKQQIKKDTGLSIEVIHPVLTTSLPKKFRHLSERILEWCEIKNNDFRGQAGLQFSINSTDEGQRSEMYKDMQLSLPDLAKIAEQMPDPVSRKYCLNFAYSTDFIVDSGYIDALFDREKFMVKITPIHNNNACRANNIKTEKGYESYEPYQPVEEGFKNLGWDVLVFVPSMDEEEGLVTCGNAVLGGSSLRTEAALNIQGLVFAGSVTKGVINAAI